MGAEEDDSRVDIKRAPRPEHGFKALRWMVVDVEHGFIYKLTLLRMYALVSVIVDYHKFLVSYPQGSMIRSRLETGLLAANAQIRRGKDSPNPSLRFLKAHLRGIQPGGRELWSGLLISEKVREKNAVNSWFWGWIKLSTKDSSDHIMSLERDGRYIVCGLLETLYSSNMCI